MEVLALARLPAKEAPGHPEIALRACGAQPQDVNLLLAASNKGCNGAVIYARRLAPLLAARGHRVWLAARPDSWIAEATRGEVALFPTDFSRWPLGELRRVADFCRAESIQLVHSHLTRASNFAALLQILHGIPSLAHLHANHPQLHVWFHRRVLAVSSDTLGRWSAPRRPTP